MAEAPKYLSVSHDPYFSDIGVLSPFIKKPKALPLAYAFIFTFVFISVFIIFHPYSPSPSPFFFPADSSPPLNFRLYRSRYTSIVSYFLHNTSSSSSENAHTYVEKSRPLLQDFSSPFLKGASDPTDVAPSQTPDLPVSTPYVKEKVKVEATAAAPLSPVVATAATPPPAAAMAPVKTEYDRRKGGDGGDRKNTAVSSKEEMAVSYESYDEKAVGSLAGCDLYTGMWVRDESYPLYKHDSCSVIDEQFNCIINGRPDTDYQKLKWKPNSCTLPRLDGRRMLELLRGKRLVFVGDSLNRNMWESLVCILRGSSKDPNNVFEASGSLQFRTESSYSFIFQDYNCSVEFFVTPFLVREWKTVDSNGSNKETLRLDLIESSADHYKTADILIFNTGHWWTHDKTSKGMDYYQEGSNVYNKLNVLEAFRRALTTWGRWIDANVDPLKTSVFFRGYSASHFGGRQWNSGGACDNETRPIENKEYLNEYSDKMMMLERVMKGMKTKVNYLNVTEQTDYRKDGHPSIYRKKYMTPEERQTPLLYQDCSHWCLPGVPDSWNEILYTELLMKKRKN